MKDEGGGGGEKWDLLQGCQRFAVKDSHNVGRVESSEIQKRKERLGGAWGCWRNVGGMRAGGRGLEGVPNLGDLRGMGELERKTDEKGEKDVERRWGGWSLL